MWIGLCACQCLVGQHILGPLPLVVEQTLEDGRVAVVMDNITYAPFTVDITGSGKNLASTPALPARVVVPPRTKASMIIFGPADPEQEWTYTYERRANIGDYSAIPDSGMVYALPFAKGAAFKVIQSYGGSFSHDDETWEHSIDFGMAVGTPVHAARDGVVMALKEDSNLGGPTVEYADDANLIWILHDDGTIGVYLHLLQNGVLVDRGDRVLRGQRIGTSGNTGFSTTPHLHFHIWRLQADPYRFVSVPVYMFTLAGPVLPLSEQAVYARPPEDALFADLRVLTTVWAFSDAYGYVHFVDASWIYMPGFGWVWVHESAESGMWLWHATSSRWLHSGPEIFPWVWDPQSARWAYGSLLSP